MRSKTGAKPSRAAATGLALGLAAAVGALAHLPAGPAAAEGKVERLVLVIDPLTAETNRFWGTAGDLGLDPSMQRLIGNDPITGEYVNTGLAERWEANEDFTEWTFHLKPEAEWHFDWGRSPRTTWCSATICTPVRTRS